jgi:ubiquinone biosynthesis protein COQ9
MMNSVQQMLARHLRTLRVSRIPCTVVERPSLSFCLSPPSRSVASFSTAAAAASHTAASLDEYKRQLLQAALENVIPYGWTNEAISVAASTVVSNGNNPSISMATAGLITVPNVLAYAMEQWNAQLRRDLEQQQQNIEFFAHWSLEQRLQWALWQRLSYVQPMVRAQRWHEALAVSVESNVAVASGSSFDSLLIAATPLQIAAAMDIILTECTSRQSNSKRNSKRNSGCATAAPDIKLDVEAPQNEYSLLERVSLGAIYVAAELHMIADTSLDFGDTRTFVQHRVQEWETLRNQSFGSSSSSSSNVFAYHSPSDMAYTASVVGSALASGIMSLATSSSSHTPRKR